MLLKLGLFVSLLGSGASSGLAHVGQKSQGGAELEKPFSCQGYDTGEEIAKCCAEDEDASCAVLYHECEVWDEYGDDYYYGFDGHKEMCEAFCDEDSSHSWCGMPGWLIAVIVISVLVFVGGICGMIICCCLCCCRKNGVVQPQTRPEDPQVIIVNTGLPTAGYGQYPYAPQPQWGPPSQYGGQPQYIQPQYGQPAEYGGQPQYGHPGEYGGQPGPYAMPQGYEAQQPAPPGAPVAPYGVYNDG
jgi:hypothetical protein